LLTDDVIFFLEMVKATREIAERLRTRLQEAGTVTPSLVDAWKSAQLDLDASARAFEHVECLMRTRLAPNLEVARPVTVATSLA
jgi:hypothetical protein